MIATCHPRGPHRFDGLAMLCFIAACLLVGHFLAGCASRSSEAAYGAELLQCVDRAATLAESKACRAQVNARWGVDAGDGGSK